MAIERKEVNTFWCFTEQYWKIYLTPEAPDRELSISLPKEGTIEESISSLREKIKENLTYKKFADRSLENFQSMLEGKTRVHEIDWGYWSQVAGNFFSLATVVNLAVLFFLLRGNSNLRPPTDGLNVSQEELQNNSISQYNRADAYSDVLLSAGIIFGIITFILNSFSSWYAQREKEQKLIYDDQIKKLLGRLIEIENEINAKEHTTEILCDFILGEKYKRPLFRGGNTTFINTLFSVLDNKKDKGIYDRLQGFFTSFYESLSPVTLNNINKIILILVKEKLKITMQLNITHLQQGYIDQCSSLKELVRGINEFKLFDGDSLRECIEQLIYILEDKNRLILLSKLVESGSYLKVIREGDIAIKLITSFNEYLGENYLRCSYKFEVICKKTEGIFKENNSLKELENAFLRLSSVRVNDSIDNIISNVMDSIVNKDEMDNFLKTLPRNKPLNVMVSDSEASSSEEGSATNTFRLGHIVKR